jgi:hypothetical protein
MKMLVVLVVMSIGLIQPQPAFERGENVHVFKADGTAAEPAVQRIIAVGGDRLRIEERDGRVIGRAWSVIPTSRLSR